MVTEITPPGDAGPANEVFVRSFVGGLSPEEKDQFDAVLRELGREHPDISPLHRAVMAVAYVIQTHLLAEAYRRAKDGEDLTSSEKMLLEWSRKTYDSHVGSRLAKDKVAAEGVSFHAVLAEYLARPPDESPVFDREWKTISVEDVEKSANFRRATAPAEQKTADEEDSDTIREIEKADAPPPTDEISVDGLDVLF